MADSSTEITLAPRVFGHRRDDLPPEVQALVDKGWSEPAAREAVAVREGTLGGDSGLE